MDPLVSTLILVFVALVGARFSFSTPRVPPGPRLLFRTGTHFLFVGVLLGPHVLQLVTAEALEQLFPLLALGLGWIGFLFGMQLDWDHLRRFPVGFHVFAYGQAVLTFALFLGVGWAGLEVSGLGGDEAHLLLLGAAATACVTTPAGIALVSANFLVRGPVRNLLFFIASLDALVGIVALQVGYALYRPASLVAGQGAVGAPFWVLGGIGLGVVLGLIFVVLSRPRPGADELVLFLLGIAALGSGAALQLQLSPLFVSVVMGAVVANFSPDRQRVFDSLQRWEKPIYVVLLLLAGALLELPTRWVVPLAIAYVVVRAAGKLLGSALMSRVVPLSFTPPRRVGLGLIPQGGISLAMAISLVLTYTGLRVDDVEAARMLFEVVVIGVVISELVAPFATHQVLRRAGEISQRVERALAEGDRERAHAEALRQGGAEGPAGPSG